MTIYDIYCISKKYQEMTSDDSRHLTASLDGSHCLPACGRYLTIIGTFYAGSQWLPVAYCYCLWLLGTRQGWDVNWYRTFLLIIPRTSFCPGSSFCDPSLVDVGGIYDQSTWVHHRFLWPFSWILGRLPCTNSTPHSWCLNMPQPSRTKPRRACHTFFIPFPFRLGRRGWWRISILRATHANEKAGQSGQPFLGSFLLCQPPIPRTMRELWELWQTYGLSWHPGFEFQNIPTW